jgi:hypothetical protein
MRRQTYAVAALAGAALLTMGSLALAAKLAGPPSPPNTKSFHASLNGFHETPSISSTGYGSFDAKLVDAATLHYVFTYAGLEGGASLFAHVHFGQVGFAGGVSFFLCGGGGKPACPNVEGTVEGDVTAADVVGPNAQGIEPGSFDEIVNAMRAGHAYANIHTTRWPTGEIRGQINNSDQKEFGN